jgi:hypothetical protein
VGGGRSRLQRACTRGRALLAAAAAARLEMGMGRYRFTVMVDVGAAVLVCVCVTRRWVHTPKHFRSVVKRGSSDTPVQWFAPTTLADLVALQAQVRVCVPWESPVLGRSGSMSAGGGLCLHGEVTRTCAGRGAPSPC